VIRFGSVDPPDAEAATPWLPPAAAIGVVGTLMRLGSGRGVLDAACGAAGDGTARVATDASVAGAIGADTVDASGVVLGWLVAMGGDVAADVISATAGASLLRTGLVGPATGGPPRVGLAERASGADAGTGAGNRDCPVGTGLTRATAAAGAGGDAADGAGNVAAEGAVLAVAAAATAFIVSEVVVRLGRGGTAATVPATPGDPSGAPGAAPASGGTRLGLEPEAPVATLMSGGGDWAPMV
jgi:hypothetical protein